ncbi:MAG: helix-turn-helix domain-containing protein [archaeon GB-1867-035]|nr:helix-turn-helix domain-containing protein [Candidatus Culexmicrobium profundum]
MIKPKQDYINLTERQRDLLMKLYKSSKSITVLTVPKSQSELARELGITRQALSIHLRKFKEEGLIRTGRGFIDLTEKALKVLKIRSANAFVFIKIQPQLRQIAYEKIKKLSADRLYRVTGEIDLIAIVDQSMLDSFLRSVSKVEGVISTSAHIVIESLKNVGGHMA